MRQEILRLRDTERLTERQIARRLEMTPSTVHYWLAKEDARGAETLRPARGRPRVTNRALDQAIYEFSLSNPFSSAIDIRDELALGISPDTVRKRLKEQGLKCRIPARKPFLKKEHIEKRLNFARRHFNWGVEQWESVLFTDEKIFRSSTKGPLRVYRPIKSDRFDKKYLVASSNPRGNFTINVWAVFGKGYREIHRVQNRSLNALYYTQVILPIVENRLVQNNLIYMQDLASVHTSKVTKAWFQSKNIEVMDDWPPKGADLNPVEHVWAELVRRTRNDATNKDQLYENVCAAFWNLPEAYFDKLIESMPRRIDQVLKAEGGFTKY